MKSYTLNKKSYYPDCECRTDIYVKWSKFLTARWGAIPLSHGLIKRESLNEVIHNQEKREVW